MFQQSLPLMVDLPMLRTCCRAIFLLRAGSLRRQTVLAPQLQGDAERAYK